MKTLSKIESGEIGFEGAVFTFNGQRYVQLSNPEIETNVCYLADAYAIDEDDDYLDGGYTFCRIHWDIVNKDCEDESDACNWNEYTIITS